MCGIQIDNFIVFDFNQFVSKYTSFESNFSENLHIIKEFL